MRDAPHLRAHLHHPLILPGGIAHELTLVDGVGKRLLDVYVLAGLAREHGQAGVPVVRGGDDKAVDVLIVEYPAELFSGSGRLLLRFFQFRTDLVENRLVDVTKGLDLSALLDGPHGVVAALVAPTYQREHNLLIGAARAWIQIQERSGCESGNHCRFCKKRSASFVFHNMNAQPQKTSFNEKLMLLGSDAELVTVPKAELVGVVFGAANTGWFNALNISAWNCMASRS